MALNHLSASFLGSSSAGRFKASLSGFPPASRIFVGNLSFCTSENAIQKEFSRFGQILEVKLVKDEETNRSKGYGFLQFSSQDSALLAIEEMDSKYLNGRIIHVELAKPSRFASYPRTSGPPDLRTIKTSTMKGELNSDTVGPADSGT